MRKVIYNIAMKKAILLLIGLAVLCLFMGGNSESVDANTPIPGLTYEGVWGSGPCMDTAYDGTYVYYLGYRTGLEVLDITEPRRPLRIGGVYTPSFPGGEMAAETDVLVRDGYAYITATNYQLDDGILQIVDLANPSAPVSTAHLVFDGRVTGLAVRDGYAYLSIREGGVKIFDVRNPYSPVQVGGFFIDGITGDVAAGYDNNLIYAVNENSMRIIDVSAPASPVLVGSYTLTDNDIGCVAIGENGEYAFIGGYGGLVTVDITDPASPRETNFYRLPYVHNIKIENNTAYVSASGLRLLDIASPSSPRELAYWSGSFNVFDVAMAKGYVYLASYGKGLSILDISDKTDPKDIGAYDQVSEYVFGVTARDSMIYTMHSFSVFIIDAGNASFPDLTGKSNYVGSNPNSIILRDQYAYHASVTGVRILDISNPRQPEITGAYSTRWYKTYGLALKDNIAYTVRIEDRLEAIDISDPFNPEAISSLDGIGIGGIVINGDYAYVISSWAGLQVIDISNPQSMALTTLVPVNVPAETPGWWDTLVIKPLLRDNYLYIPGHRGLEVLDIGNPAAPVPVAVGVTGQTATGAEIDGDNAYVVLNDGTVSIFDISQPTAPRQTGLLHIPYGARHVFASGNHLYITSLNYQIHIYRTGSCASALIDAPGGGTICALGSSQDISWTLSQTGSNDGFVNLELFQDNHRVATIAENLPASGTFSWTVGAATGTNILVEPGNRFNIGVRRLEDNCLTLSQGNFTVPETGVSLDIEAAAGTDSSFLLSRRGILIDITVNREAGAAEISHYILKRRFNLEEWELLKSIPADSIQNGAFTYFDSIGEPYLSHEYYVEAIHPTGAIIAVSEVATVDE